MKCILKLCYLLFEKDCFLFCCFRMIRADISHDYWENRHGRGYCHLNLLTIKYHFIKPFYIYNFRKLECWLQLFITYQLLNICLACIGESY